MRGTVDLVLRMAGPEQVKKLSSVLAPDNEGTPRGLKLSVRESGDTLVFRVRGEPVTGGVSTVLAILRDVALFQEVWLLSSKRDARGQRPQA